MKIFAVAIAVFFLILICALPEPASAEETTAKPPTGAVPADQAKPTLSKDECSTLGGKEVGISAKICGSGSACSTTDQNGKHHLVCLSATRK